MVGIGYLDRSARMVRGSRLDAVPEVGCRATVARQFCGCDRSRPGGLAGGRLCSGAECACGPVHLTQAPKVRLWHVNPHALRIDHFDWYLRLFMFLSLCIQWRLFD
jgi:hypothetical protein